MALDTTTLVGTLCTDWLSWRNGRKRGAFMYTSTDANIQGLWFYDWWALSLSFERMQRPNGPEAWDHMHFLPFTPYDGHPTWSWNGNRVKPTLTPSIRICDRWYKDPKAIEIWHGYLTDGVFRSC
jgi:hypothetical protein